MDPMTIGMIAGSVLGLAKGEEDKHTEKKQRKLNAEITRYSPWTRIGQQPVRMADPTGSLLQGGLSGAMMGQGISNSMAQNKLLEAQAAQAAAGGAGAATYMPGQGMPPYANANPWTGMSPFYYGAMPPGN